jgi:hypothetical protein
MHMPWHVAPQFQSIIRRFLIAIIRHKAQLRGLWGTSFEAFGVVGRALPTQVVLPMFRGWRGNSKISIPGRLCGRLLLCSSKGELAKMRHFACLTMIAWPFAGALVSPLVMGDAGQPVCGENLLLTTLTFGARCCRTALFWMLHFCIIDDSEGRIDVEIESFFC